MRVGKLKNGKAAVKDEMVKGGGDSGGLDLKAVQYGLCILNLSL